ncbi:uncharacterized protein LOC143296731 [Babylonia areolata]|uniref:uncharacterized protein LOC143296731 n=1 Tax=Babylonia areolata TaxID=304850 RepID=UPI003FD4302B
MPSLSQFLGVKKGSNSPTSRQGFSPFSRKSTSAASRGRQHLRTKSDNSVGCYNGTSGTRWSDISKRTSPKARYGQDYRESYDSRYERYRQIYLATSPERELSTLNAAIVNVRKWLKKKHHCLQSLQRRGQQSSPVRGSSSTGGNKTPSHGEDSALSPQALLEKLVTEAGHQQEAVDVLLDRGRRYLQQRACITLEVDLDNLAFLWNSYTKQLFVLHDQDQGDSPLSQSGYLSPPEGKENLLQHSTPVKWKRGARPPASHRLCFSDTPEKSYSPEFSDTPEKSLYSLGFSDTLEEGYSPGFSLDENGISHSDLNNSNPNFAASDKCETALSVSSSSEVHFDTLKEDLSERQSSNADVAKIPVCKGNLGEDEEKISSELLAKEFSENKPQESSEKACSALFPVSPVPVRKGNSEAEQREKVQEPAKKAEDHQDADCRPTEEEEKEEEDSTEKKCSPRSLHRKVSGATQWPAQNRAGWLRIAGEGIFTSSPRPSSRTTLLTPDLPSPSSKPGCGADLCLDLSRAAPCQNAQSCPGDVGDIGGAEASSAGEGGVLGKRGKEIHNEQQQKQARKLQVTQDGGHHHGNPTDTQLVGLQLQLGLTASEENLKMEIEKALKEINGLPDGKGDNSTDLTDSPSDTNGRSSDSESLSPDDPDLPTGPKRRRMNGDPAGSMSSGSGSPLMSADSSMAATPTSSPAGTLPRDFRQRYKKDELWKAIESNYQYLMDKEIIETCQSTETALTGEEEDVVPNVSFTEFLKQYQELIDWLNQTQRNTQRTLTSLSEKYLNQTYHEEMLEKCPRREFLTKYSQQLVARFPHLREQVTCRMQRLHAQWALVESAIAPQQGDTTVQSMKQDLEVDLAALRRWLNATESRLLPLTIRADWTDAELEERLRHHQVLQQDIESHSRIVSAVLKLSERVEREASCTNASDCQSLQLVALTLERRWHGIWLQSLEWQCRLEEAINRRKGLYGSGINFSGFTLPTLDESCGSDLDIKSNGNVTASSNGSLIELSDDSLLFIGARTEHHVGDSSGSGPTSPGHSLTLHTPPPLASPKLTNFLDRSSGDSANISECESKMGDSPRGAPGPEDQADGPVIVEGAALGRGMLKKGPQESKDIGYSSESQSNDETESMQQQIALECRFPGIIEVCSDSPLGEKMTLPAPGAVRPDYYCMTHVDLDSTTDKTTTDDGNTTDDRENVSRHGDGGRKVEAGVGVEGTVVVTKVGSVCPPSAGINLSPRGSCEDIAVKSYLESSDEVEGVHLVEDGLPPCSLSESDSAADSQEKIRYLIDHAEDLVKTSPRSAGPGSPQRKMSPSKQTQTVLMETSSVESSCDASSENSEESGNEEFSTATDDADDTLFDSVINLDSTMDSMASREDVSLLVPNSVDCARLRKQTGPRGAKKDRPWSVAGVQGLKKTTDFQPLSTSESAIDRMHMHTDTDSSCCQFASCGQASTFLRPERHRGYQRAFSACEQSSPRAAKRKLKYSSSSSATDSQASRSSATQVAASTEDEDDKTFMYDSTEQLRSFQGVSSSLLESESETTDDYVTASMDEVITSADEDPHNSTGSFSENAWDNYQMIYPTASEDATEEVLHWEPVDDMEFDDDFNLTFHCQSSRLSEAISKRANKMHLKGMQSGDDSDSDMEDFRSVLEDSETCLKVVDHSLKKKRSNPMGSGLASPSKYVEMLATCETNMECVKNVCQHLTQEDIGMGDVQRVQALLCQWEKLHGVASDRLQQSQQLGVVGEALTTMKTLLSSVGQCLAACDVFTSKEELHSAISSLRVKEEELEKQRQVIGEHRQVIESFVQHHPSVKVSRYQEELQSLDSATQDCQHRVSGQLQSLQTNFTVWCEYLEGQQELDTLMAADRERLYALLAQREAGRRVTRREVLRELETLQSNLSVYESKLCVLQALRQRLTRVSDDQTQRAFLASLADLRNQLHVVSERCRQMYRDVEEEEEEMHVDTPPLGQLAMSPASLLDSPSRHSSRLPLTEHGGMASAMEEGRRSYLPAQQGREWWWLRSVPVQVVALIMVAGLVYVLDPDLLSHLTSFSLTCTPELRHDNGPSGL